MEREWWESTTHNFQGPDDHELLEDIPEMRPEPLPFPTWYDEADLRDNHDRAYIGLDDWQADFPRSE